MPTKIINPFLIVLFFASAGLAGFVGNIPEGTMATIVLQFFLVITFINPFNSINFLLLSTPFFLGEASWPYYWMTEAMVFVTILSAAIHFARRKEKIEVPLKYPLILLLFASLCSIPIDGKEFYYDFWAHSFGDMFAWWLASHPTPKLHYLRMFTNMASGMALFLISFHFVREHDFGKIATTFKGVVIMCGGVCVLGILMVYDVIGSSHDVWHYMTLSVVGNYLGAITAFSFALHFFAQYLLLALPMTLYFIYINRKSPASLAFYTTIFALLSFCIIQGGLRVAALLLYITVFIALAFYIVSFIRTGKRGKRAVIWVAIIIATIVTVYLLTESRASQRFTTDILDKINMDMIKEIPNFIDDPLFFLKKGISEPRFFLWHTAVLMFFSSPLLGIGLGRFTHLFMEYFASDYYNWDYIGFAINASAHSFYFEILANQGIIGFLLWSLLIGTVICGAIKTIRKESTPKIKFFYIAILSSIFIWLGIGAIHHVTLSRIIEIYFWIILGMLAGYSWGEIKNIELGKKKATIAFAVIVLAFFYQINLVMARPIPPDFNTGFLNWEKKPDGNHYRWMGKRGAYMAEATDGKISFSLVVTMDGLEQEPQKVNVWVGDSTREIVINNRELFTIDIPVESKEGQYMVWMEADHTYDPIEKRLGHYGTPVSVLIQKPADEKTGS